MTGKADVYVEPIEDQTCDHNGENCTFSVTHRVGIDFRNAGMRQTLIGDYCETCATELANAIKDSLPETDE